MTKLVFYMFFLFLAGCGSSDPHPATGTTMRDQCVKWCYRRFQCYQDVCQADYPGSAPAIVVSSMANDCVSAYCDTDDFAKDQRDQKTYFRCTMERSCREITTGACGDVATCTKDPTSTPYLPGSMMKAPPKS